MDLTTYRIKKQEFLARMMPHKLIAPQELTHVGGNVFSLQGVDIEASADFVDAFDKIIGVDKQHRKIVKNASGETGLTNYRNYFNAARNMGNPTPVIIVASPTQRKLTNVIRVVQDYITPGLFFDFVEMMADETGFEIDEIRYDHTDRAKVTVSFLNPNSEPDTFGTDEEILTDGFYLKWQPTYVEMGHYYLRLVCTNGMTKRSERRDTTVHRLEAREVQRLIALVKDNSFREAGVKRFGELLDRARYSRISLSEMHGVHRQLAQIGLEPETVETLVPYERVKEMYQSANMYDGHREHLLKGENTIWETYNVLTDFASHTPLVPETDYRRVKIMEEADRLLNHTPDIVNYYDIF